MLRVLFVDDEPHVLESLQDALRSRRNEWQVTCAGSAVEAWARLETSPFDVVVSDVRMPTIDGLAFLGEVKQRWPHLIRIVLSGHTDAAAARKLLRVAHQFLSKPCAGPALQEALDRAGRVRQLIADEAVRAMVGRIDRLPARPRVYGELMGALSRANVSVAEISGLLEREPALSAKLLQIVNSSFFRLARRITRVEDAVIHLGLEQIKNLALSAEIFQCGDRLTPRSGLDADAIARHSLLTARIAERLFGKESFGADAFLAGLVHEIGLLVLGLELPDQLAEAVRTATGTGISFAAAQKRQLGVTDAEVGGYLLGLWGLPYAILEAVLWHHGPGDSAPATGSFGLTGALHVANALAGEFAAAVPAMRGPAVLDLDYLARVGVASRIDDWRAQVAQEVARLGEDPARPTGAVPRPAMGKRT